MAQNQLFTIFLPNFVILYNYHKISSRYQRTEKHFSDAITAFYNGDYINPTAGVQVFQVSTKTIHQKLDGKASKSSQLPSNRSFSLEQE